MNILNRLKSKREDVKCDACNIIFNPMQVRLELDFNICKPCYQKDPQHSILRYEDLPLTYKHYICDPAGSGKFSDKKCDLCARSFTGDIGNDLYCFNYALCEDCFYTDAVKPQLFRWIHSFVDTVGPPKSICHGCQNPMVGKDCSYPDFFVCNSCPDRPNLPDLLVSIRKTLPSAKTPGMEPFIKLYRRDASKDKRMRDSMSTCHVCVGPQPERDPMWAINYMLCRTCNETPNEVVLSQFRGMFSRHIQRLVPWPDRQTMYKKTGVELGRGKSGRVLMVRSTSSKAVDFAQKLVCFKNVVKKEVLECAKKRADPLVEISHPNVVKGIDVFDSPPNGIKIIMELATSDLEHWLVGKRLSKETAWKLAADLAQGLNHLHNHYNIVHNDVTASNILVFERQGNQGEGIVRTFKLGALAIAAMPEDLPLTGASVRRNILGCDRYLAPEVLRDRADPAHRTPASDMWGLGCVLYYATEGRHPFFGEQDTDDQAWFNIALGQRQLRFTETDGALAHVIRGLLRFPETEKSPRFTAERVLQEYKMATQGNQYFLF